MTPTQPGQPDLAELRRLAEAATPGPWWGDPPYGWGLFQDAPTHAERLWLFDRKDGTPADAAYIVALANAAPALLARIEALETALERAIDWWDLDSPDFMAKYGTLNTDKALGPARALLGAPR